MGQGGKENFRDYDEIADKEHVPLSGSMTVVLGIEFLSIGGLLDRVKFLENHLNVSYERAIKKNEALPQRKCPNCGKVHGFDYPKWPNCKHTYNVIGDE